MSGLQRRALKLTLIALFAAGLLGFLWSGGDELLTLDALRANRDRLLAYTADHYAIALVSSFLIYAVATALSIPAGAILSLTMGMLFGRWVGTLVTVLASSVGATLLFVGARFVLLEWAQGHIKRHPAAARLVSGFETNAFNFLLFLRLVPIFPFWLVNLVPVVTSINVRTYFAATLIGILPASFAYVNFGQVMGEIHDVGDLLSREVLISLSLLGLLALAPIFFRDKRGEAP